MSPEMAIKVPIKATSDEPDGMENEIGMMSVEKEMTFPDDQRLLEHPNFWIADTAASVHMTPHKQGVTNIESAQSEISMGNKTI